MKCPFRIKNLTPQGRLSKVSLKSSIRDIPPSQPGEIVLDAMRYRKDEKQQTLK